MKSGAERTLAGGGYETDRPPAASPPVRPAVRAAAVQDAATSIRARVSAGYAASRSSGER